MGRWPLAVDPHEEDGSAWLALVRPSSRNYESFILPLNVSFFLLFSLNFFFLLKHWPLVKTQTQERSNCYYSLLPMNEFSKSQESSRQGSCRAREGSRVGLQDS